MARMIDIGDTSGQPDYSEHVRTCCWKYNRIDPFIPVIRVTPTFQYLVCDEHLVTVRIMQAVCPQCGQLWQGWDYRIAEK